MSTSNGTPHFCMAATNASHTAVPEGRPFEDGRCHDESRVVVDPGEYFALTATDEKQPADEVELPQVHRRFALPTFVDPFVLLLLMIDQSVADQDSVDGGTGWAQLSQLGGKFEANSTCAPPSVMSAHLTDEGFDVCVDA
ncbi:hypothetical protein [Rhodococcoides fascians]|uniref:hypothetical protein n=1 Tax=Rhodococcoides fascians TaxID=1828 RepID=UPI001E4C60EB|nr:hypothetical protein [Rhodococcus fascians]